MHVKEVATSRELMWNLTLRELRGRYKRTALGFGWSLLNPLATMLVFTLVFRFLLRAQPEPGNPSGLHVFALWLLCGVLTWAYFANATSASMGAMLGNANLVKKVYFPREVLVFATVASLLITHFIELGILAVALMVFGNFVLPWLPVMLVVVALLTIFNVGVGLALAALNVYFRDLNHLWGIIIQMWFYLTPVVYPLALVRDRMRARGWHTLYTIYDLNPMNKFVAAVRNILYDLRMPTLGTFAYLCLCAGVSLTIGSWTFNKLSRRFAEEL